MDTFPTCKKTCRQNNAVIKAGHASCLFVVSLLSNQWRMQLSRQRVSIPRAGICYWYGSGLSKLCNTFAVLSPVSLRWRAILQPVNCHQLSLSYSENGSGKRAQASVTLLETASFDVRISLAVFVQDPFNHLSRENELCQLTCPVAFVYF